MKSTFISGQRWFSEAEPELGMGCVVAADERRVRVRFPTREIQRDYACDTAPLRRVRFKVGDTVTSRQGTTFKVDEVVETAGLLTYCDGDQRLSETDLSETLDFGTPEERLALGMVDDNAAFNLRYQALGKQSWLESLRLKGLMGARITLLSHQLYIAAEVSERYHLRVMLGDEVGLGKTIEAGLIVHRQLLTGMCSRVLILLPESLTHQWFLEMWRRFNLTFSIFDEERCLSLVATHQEINPFLDSSLVICSLEFLLAHPQRMAQLTTADWDLLVVDEAHHLTWEPDTPSMEYQLVERLARHTPGMLLLSGTPEQLGENGHFARLRLLDPHRFHDLGQFHEAQLRYVAVAGIIEKLMEKKPLNKKEQQAIANLFRYDLERLQKQLQAIAKGDADVRQRLIAELVDRHGTGRLFYRNQRRGIAGFPARVATLYPLTMNQRCEELYGHGSADDEITHDAAKGTDRVEEIPFIPRFLGPIAPPEFCVLNENWKVWWKYDPRVAAVLGILNSFPDEKVLLICARRETAQALKDTIEQRLKIKMAVFHEGLDLVSRDRNAAYFADPDGARLLICSEIGSEGRNFQFCHHLILFDTPFNPELLEQRIGRLDRLGQAHDVHVHVLYLESTRMEVLVKWYHDGFDAFQRHVSGGTQLFERFSRQVEKLAIGWQPRFDQSQLDRLIAETRKARKEIESTLRAGRDRLLQWHSHQPDIGQGLVAEIAAVEAHSDLAAFMENLCQRLGVRVEDHDRQCLMLRPGDHYHGLAGLPDEGVPVTFDRARALAREDLTFLTWEHPMVLGGIEHVLGSSVGRVSYGFWEDQNMRAVLLEAVFLLHTLARESLRSERFLPPTPIRVLINHEQSDLTEHISHEQLLKILHDDLRPALLQKPEVTQQLLPPMIATCRQLAEVKKERSVAAAMTKMKRALETEIHRLTALSAANAPVRQEEITHLQAEYQHLETAISTTQLRLDALRVIWRGPNMVA